MACCLTAPSHYLNKCVIQLRAISKQATQLLFCIMTILFLKLLPHLPGNNELMDGYKRENNPLLKPCIFCTNINSYGANTFKHLTFFKESVRIWCEPLKLFQFGDEMLSLDYQLCSFLPHFYGLKVPVMQPWWIWAINAYDSKKKTLLFHRILITETSHKRHGFSTHSHSIVHLTACSVHHQSIIITLHHWSFVRGIHRWPVNSPHKVPVMHKVFPYHKVIMYIPLPAWHGTDPWLYITGPLWGESTSEWWIPHTKGQ